MSIYSTLDLTTTEAIKLIAEHIGVYEDGKTNEWLLSKILFKITDQNIHSPYCDNNYWIKPD